MNSENIPKTSEDRRLFPNLKEAWILALCLLPLSFVAFALQGLLKAFNLNAEIVDLISYVVSCGGLIVIAMLYKNHAGDHSAICYKNRVSIWVYILSIPAIYALSGFVDIISASVLPEMPQELQTTFAEKMNLSIPVLLTVAVAAPVLEEIFCRGIICEGLIKNNSPLTAILWSACIFAVIHLNPWQGLSAFVIGCFLGWIYYKTRSVIPCIFIHFITNSIAVFTYHYYTKLGYDMDTTTAEIHRINEVVLLLAYVTIFAACLFLLTIIMNKTIKNNSEKYS